MAIRVLIADDHPIVRSGIRNELTQNAEIQVVGEAVDGDGTLQSAKELHPDVLLLDINMPGLKAVQVLRKLAEQEDSPRVLVLTAYGDSENVIGMLSAGAEGYLLKDSSPDEIIAGVLAVAKGNIWLSPAVAKVLVENSVNEGNINSDSLLTAREQEILALLGRGYGNSQIAEKLVISESTVKNHVTKIYDKLDFHSRAEAVAWAWQHGLVKT